jgi:D-arabinose 1-dehydrogenase
MKVQLLTWSAGYPLPTLLRIALLILHNPPYKPLDLVLSYCHLTLQNDTLKTLGPLFRHRAQVGQVLNASPLSMGLLTPTPPLWHPAPKGVITAAKHAYDIAATWAGGLPNLALGYAMRYSLAAGMPLAVGFSSPNEVHESVRVWRKIQERDDDDSRRAKEAEVICVFEKDQLKNSSWPCP